MGLSIHAPDHWQKIVSAIELERLLSTGDHVGIHVLVGDIRKSTFLMKESISLKRFALITRDFMKAVRDTAGKNEGWFDKFTGDGFIIYWIYEFETNQQKYISQILSFSYARLYIPGTHEGVSHKLYKFSRWHWVITGVEPGLCTLVDIEDLNIIGPPVVGASQMAAEAKPFELLFSVSTAAWLTKIKTCLLKTMRLILKKILKLQNKEK